VDGCGAPALAVTPVGLARAFGRLASATPGTRERRVADALRAHPRWLGGTGRDVSRLVAGVPGLIAKDGAESVYAVGLADGTGLTVKITDGDDRARVVVMTAALRRLGVLDLGPDVAALLDELDGQAVVRGHGEPVGRVLAVPLP
jgi:L-asparaginase II